MADEEQTEQPQTFGLFEPPKVIGTDTGSILNGQTVEVAGHSIGSFSSGCVLLDADFNGDTITFKVSDSLGGTYTVLNGVSFLAVTGWNNLPDDLFKGTVFFKLVTSAAVSADRTNTYGFKS